MSCRTYITCHAVRNTCYNKLPARQGRTSVNKGNPIEQGVLMRWRVECRLECGVVGSSRVGLPAKRPTDTATRRSMMAFCRSLHATANTAVSQTIRAAQLAVLLDLTVRRTGGRQPTTIKTNYVAAYMAGCVLTRLKRHKVTNPPLSVPSSGS
jgi:hypothetical protein